MRPEILYPCFAPVESLKGVGPRLAPVLAKAIGPRIVDLLWHLPRDLIDRRHRPKIKDAAPGAVATLTVTVMQHQPPADGRRVWRVVCHDETGTITLVFFRANARYVRETLPLNSARVVSGHVDAYDGRLQMVHPDYIVAPEDADSLPAVEPVYPLSAGVTPGVMRRVMERALRAPPALDEWHDPALMRRHGWPDWRDALVRAHGLESAEDLSPDAPARMRLAYDELLANQLALGLTRARLRGGAGRGFSDARGLRAKALAALPFSLTRWQRAVLEEIDADMAAPARMLRLLQGDVGSGKTVVALLAMLNAVSGGAQAALMAPSEILARQHMAVMEPFLKPLGVRMDILTGRHKGAAREETLVALRAGEIDVLVGTHALFQDGVKWRDLGMVVVDEQHRFGVQQRLALAARGASPDMLVMTATPIPRTLAMAAYGGLDVSSLRGKPPGREPPETVVIPMARLDDVVTAVARRIAAGARVYWICPLVAESEGLDIATVEERAAALSRRFGAARVGAIHGQMPPADKDAAMRRFASGEISALVASTVVEVGVDVPAASVMVIENAERFGLAQLHQLRGRIGRGGGRATCILLRGIDLSEAARARLLALRETDDGFALAERDMALRGPGDALGVRQSGLPDMRLASLPAHVDLLAMAHDDARRIVATDPELEGARGPALRVLLHLFARDAAVANLRSG